MAENETKTPESGSDLFTPAERQYFDSRGDTPIPEPAPAEPAAEVVPEPAPAPAEPTQQETVPYGALAEERARRKESEERARQAELMQARMEERFRAWQDQATPRPTPPRAPPKPDEDIFGAVNHLMREQQRTTGEINNYKQQIAAEQQMQQLGRWAAQAEATFKQTAPDYDDALRHLRESRTNELKTTWGMNDTAVSQQLLTEERQLLVRAAQQQRNPAELAYAIAKQRGYRGKAADTGNLSKQMDIIEAGQQASKTLSSVGGKASGGVEVKLEDLVRMSDAEFAAFKAKYPARYRRLKGG
jgi:hypothetical protein